MHNPILSLHDVSFSYGGKNVIDGFSLAVEEGSFTTLLGESGCGKTTLLRIISGFLFPNSGDVRIDGKSQREIPPNKRQVGMVFQDYALFPHLTVRQNIAYGLHVAKVPKQKIEQAVLEVASALSLENFLSRYPNALSGGQQQRVALARAIVLKPRLLLMDEPLSSLDTTLREKVRAELKEIQQKLKITTVYVTHDQHEAMSLSDKIAVVNFGKLVQAGTPREIYFSPKNRFAAEFTGRTNFIEENAQNFLIRPEWFEICQKEESDFSGEITKTELLGATTRIFVRYYTQNILVDVPTIKAAPFSVGSTIFLKILRKIAI